MAPHTDSRKLLVVSAHSADFVWRAAGAIATATANGGTATVVSLSFGERGESGELWKEEGQTVERVKAIRRREAETAAGILGADVVFLDRGDYPLELDRAAVEDTLIDEDFENLFVVHGRRKSYLRGFWSPMSCTAACGSWALPMTWS